MRYVSWLLTIPLAALAVSFSVSNLAPVTLELWPLPFQVQAPAFALVLVTLVAGFLLGGLVAWVGQHGHRKAERQHQSRADKLQRELDAMRARAETAEKRLAEASAALSAAPPSVAAQALPALAHQP